MTFHVLFQQRNFTQHLATSGLKFQVDRFSKEVMGGPKNLTLTVEGNPEEIWEIVNYLRKPIQVIDNFQNPIWWGYVAEVRVNSGGLDFGITLDSMNNRISLAYSLSIGVNTRSTTSLIQDVDSIAEYGIKEIRESINDQTSQQAQQYCQNLLHDSKYPRSSLNYSLNSNEKVSATLICKGWWETLSWMLYYNSNRASSETTNQIQVILQQCGQFITGVEILEGSNIFQTSYRDGDSSALQEILTLLNSGKENGFRYYAEITQQRKIRVYQASPKPKRLEDCEFFVGHNSSIENQQGVVYEPHQMPVGFWVSPKNPPSKILNLNRLSNPLINFITRTEYVHSSKQLQLYSDGDFSPLKGLRIIP